MRRKLKQAYAPYPCPYRMPWTKSTCLFMKAFTRRVAWREPRAGQPKERKGLQTLQSRIGYRGFPLPKPFTRRKVEASGVLTSPSELPGAGGRAG